MREAFAVLIAVPFLVGAALAPASAERDEVFRFADLAIVESSGLVAGDGLVTTVNDSGDSARVFVVDPASGQTVGVTRWAAQPTDIEALAPGGPGKVWVGDIGDNSTARDVITVTRVPVARGNRTVTGEAYRLTYPSGRFDAEALLAHPRTGRLFVVTKVLLGGAVYAAPSALRKGAPNRLERLGDAPGFITDGAFFPDGRHLLLRNYDRAFVVAFPSLELVGGFDLPQQRQGEGIAVASDGTIYASSEGARTAVLRITLPPELADAVAAPAGSPSVPPSGSPSTSASPSGGPSDGASGSVSDGPSAGSDADRDAPGVGLPDPSEPQRSPVPWLAGFLVLGIVVVVLLRALRPR